MECQLCICPVEGWPYSFYTLLYMICCALFLLHLYWSFPPTHFFFSFPSGGTGRLNSFWSMSKGKQREKKNKQLRDVRKSWLVRAPAPCWPLTLPLILSVTPGSEVVWTRRRWVSLPGWVMSGVLARTHGLFGWIRRVFLSMCWTLSRFRFRQRVALSYFTTALRLRWASSLRVNSRRNVNNNYVSDMQHTLRLHSRTRASKYHMHNSDLKPF